MFFSGRLENTGFQRFPHVWEPLIPGPFSEILHALPNLLNILLQFPRISMGILKGNELPNPAEEDGTAWVQFGGQLWVAPGSSG